MLASCRLAFWNAILTDNGPRGRRYYRAFRYLVARSFRYDAGPLPWKKGKVT